MISKPNIREFCSAQSGLKISALAVRASIRGPSSHRLSSRSVYGSNQQKKQLCHLLNYPQTRCIRHSSTKSTSLATSDMNFTSSSDPPPLTPNGNGYGYGDQNGRGEHLEAEAHQQEHHHDTHAPPPEHIYQAHIKYCKMPLSELAADENVIDFSRGLTPAQKAKLKHVATVPKAVIQDAATKFRNFDSHGVRKDGDASGAEDGLERGLEGEGEDCTVYEHADFPGLRLYPGIVPPETQLLLLSRLMHRDLSNPAYKTNINLEYDMKIPRSSSSTSKRSSLSPSSAQPSPSPSLPSLFTLQPHASTPIFHPKPGQNPNPNPNLKPLTASQMLRKKLRYLTLGSQYDWSTRRYPSTHPATSPFPKDIETLVSTLFPSILRPESGVVLFYSTKDYMPPHRDVSELAQTGLVSWSLGCDGVFVLASPRTMTDGGEGEITAIRVRSGDVVQMDGETRWAWHAMSRVVPGTCPEFMEGWPVGSEGVVLDGEIGELDREKEVRKMRRQFELWRGFMHNMRVNISFRQVYEG